MRLLGMPQYQYWKRPTRLFYLLGTLLVLRQIMCIKLQLSFLVDGLVHPLTIEKG